MINSILNSAPPSVIIPAVIVAFIIGIIMCFDGYCLKKYLSLICGFFEGTIAGIVLSGVTDIVWLIVTAAILTGSVFACVSWFVKPVSRIILSGGMFALLLYCFISITMIKGAFIIALLMGIMAAVYACVFGKPIMICVTSINGAGMVAVALYAVSQLTSSPLGPALFLMLWIIISVVGILIQNFVIHTENEIYGKNIYTSYRLYKSYSERLIKPYTYTPAVMQRRRLNYCVRCGLATDKSSVYCKRCGCRIR